MIDGGKLFYGEIRELSGVWATGKRLKSAVGIWRKSWTVG